MKRNWIRAIVVALNLCLLLCGSGCGGGSSQSQQQPPQQQDPVTISPKSANLIVLSQAQQQFQAFIQGSATTSVSWLVNGVPGGNSAVGVISSNGLYLPPNEVPSGSITVTAQSVADPTQSDAASVTLQYPEADARSVAPTMIERGSGATSVTINGGPYSMAATAYLEGTALPTTFISTTQVLALIPAGSLNAMATLSLAVKNPAPGGGGSDFDTVYVYVVAGSWVQVGDLNTAREQSAAALLANGKVLVTGGKDASGNVLSSAELFDPQTNTFSPAGAMTVPRYDHSAITLNNGQILIAGGSPNPTTAEIYDPANDTFRATPNMNFAHSNIAILLTTGQVLLEDWFFGNGLTFQLNAEIYDATTNTFSTLTTGLPPSCGAVLDSGQCGCLGGGILGSQNLIYVGGPYYFDPSNLSFTNADPSSVAGQLSGCTVTTLLNGNVFTTGAGFNTGSILNAQAKDWNPANDTVVSFPRPALGGTTTAVRLQNGQVFLVGQIFDPSVPQLFVAPMPLFPPSGTPTAPPTAVLLQDGRVLVVGGEDQTSYAPTTAAETYVP